MCFLSVINKMNVLHDIQNFFRNGIHFDNISGRVVELKMSDEDCLSENEEPSYDIVMDYQDINNIPFITKEDIDFVHLHMNHVSCPFEFHQNRRENSQQIIENIDPNVMLLTMMELGLG
jgi:hypothetical protein